MQVVDPPAEAVTSSPAAAPATPTGATPVEPSGPGSPGPAPAARPSIRLGMLLLTPGLSALLVALGLQITSLGEAVLIGVPVTLVGLGLERTGKHLHANAMRVLGVLVLVLGIATPVTLAATPPGPLDSVQVRESVPPAVSQGTFRAAMGNGRLHVGPDSPGLVDADLRSAGTPSVTTATRGGTAVVDLDAPSQRGLLARNRGSDWNAKLTAALPWEVQVDTGVATADLDLQQLNVTAAQVTTGAARVAVRLGQPAAPATTVDVDMAGGTLDLYLPREAGVELRAGGLAVRDLGGRELTERDGALVAEGTSGARHEIDASLGAGQIRLHWQ